MKKLWKMGTLSLALAAGVIAGAAVAANGAPVQHVEAAANAQSEFCPTRAQCLMADRACKDPELTPGPCETLTLCLECGVQW
ncbi:hypothetical protein JQX13_08300 [Archangium violaceum]|uniref:hypothetical protein n=1 Tax=Archangium violaceum TaxID=83451 RepID=UPI00193B55FE|nr:hypothetical protein [Archangium violaceum]QRK10085.1 hypothetical protein JQX13_08300 [Archangium violaceum]